MFIPLESYFILLGAAFMGGLVDSIAGGGGIITVPALLAVGVPPHLALGTNKLQASFGSLTATVNYSRKGLVQVRRVIVGILFTALGAMVGALTIQSLSSSFLKHFIPVLLTVLFLYVLFAPKVGDNDKSVRLRPLLFYVLSGLMLGFYDGFFGPGVGSFWCVAFVVLLGFNLKRATAHTKVMNFTSNIIALLFFAAGGNVLLKVGIMMWPAQFLGAYIGSKLVIKHNVSFIRLFFLVVVGATILKLLYSNYMVSL